MIAFPLAAVPVAPRLLTAALAAALPLAVRAQAAPAPDAPVRSLGVVTIQSGQPTSLPTQIPTTMEGVTREQIEQSINATDSEDALKYLPSLLVRKRYIGDYNHAILSSRASGTGNSARSAVYADGILLSNFLGNGVGGLSFPPRWGLVTPEEIERVDVMYGPFSAAYPGNSVGAVVDFVTRMPTKFESHAKVGMTVQPFELYGTQATYRAWQSSASVGNRAGEFSWWLNFNRTDSHGQPQTFATRLASAGVVGPGGTPVTGAVSGVRNDGAPWFILGSGTEYQTVQDHVKAKLAWDLTPTLRAAWTMGAWQNRSQGRPVSYLRDGGGNPVYSGGINIGGVAFTGAQALRPGDFTLTDESLLHTMHGLSLKSNTRGVWDWEIAYSRYDYQRDTRRQNGTALPGAATGGAGTIADGGGTGWTTLALRGTWRPHGAAGTHIVDFGYQQDDYRLHYLTSAIAGNWITDPAGAMASQVGGRTRLQSLWGQDTWRLAPHWRAVLGLRAEHWTAREGITQIPGAVPAVNTQWPERQEAHLSPKAALSWQAARDTVIRASIGRAVRMPTVAELYGATSTTNAQYINDPNLRPEKSWTGELSAERDWGDALGRVTLFAESTRDALYNQTVFDPIALVNVSRVQNVGRVATQGVEFAFNGTDVVTRGLDLSASLTWTRSIIKENAGFVVVPGDTVGKWQPNIARWRASVLATYRWSAQWTTSVGARFSNRQFRTLNNSDVIGSTYQGVSPFRVVDLRVRWQVSRQLAAAFGVDNLTNDKHWNFHPYPQRSYSAELKWNL